MTSPSTISTSDDHLIEWLLEGDPSIRVRVLRDLLGSDAATVDAERRRVAEQGWGERLLAAQDPAGTWSGALYSPKWTSTTYTLLLLHWLGLPRGHLQAAAGCRILWDEAKFYGDGLTLARSIREPETCITAMLVLLAARFDHRDRRVDPTVGWLLDQQLDDGGWNCETIRSGSTHGSFHTSISVLDALVEYQDADGPIPVAEAMERGREFFLDHHLYRSHHTGEVANPAFIRFPFPPQWHFDVLRGLEHFATVGAPVDPRLGEAIGVICRARRRDGAWPVHAPYPGRAWFRMEPAGASRWATVRALTVLKWWMGENPAAP